jgi:hypothetical protein
MLTNSQQGSSCDSLTSCLVSSHAHDVRMLVARESCSVLVRMAVIWSLVFNLLIAGWMTGAHAAASDQRSTHLVICTTEGALLAPEGDGAPQERHACDCTLCASFHVLPAPERTSQAGAGWSFLARLGDTSDRPYSDASESPPNNRGPPILT